jgi:acyl dehydratase
MAALDLRLFRNVFALALTLTASHALAEGDDEAAKKSEETPRFTGNGSVTQAINGDLGAILDIGGGQTMTFPKGIPVGRSRLVTLKKAAKPSGPQVHKGFTPLGNAVEFNTPVSAGRAPIVLAQALKKDPSKKGARIVVAMEVGTLCNEDNKKYKLKNGLCSGWEIFDAQYDAAGAQLVAKLQSTGGLRLVFGLLEE